MFIFSFSPKKISKKIWIAIGAVILIIVTVIIVASSCQNQNQTINYGGESYSNAADSVNDMKKFMSQFGWEISSQPSEVTEIVIPSQFNDVYEHYNDIQKSLGLDLSKYKGETCKKYNFKILNYPNDSDVSVNLLVLNGKIIGGDISENILDGFMKNLVGM